MLKEATWSTSKGVNNHSRRQEPGAVLLPGCCGAPAPTVGRSLQLAFLAEGCGLLLGMWGQDARLDASALRNALYGHVL